MMRGGERIIEALTRSRYRVALLIAFGAAFLRIQNYVKVVSNTIKLLSINIPAAEEIKSPLSLIMNPNILLKILANNWDAINLLILSIGLSLFLYSVYKSRVIFMLTGVSLIYSFYIIIIWLLYTLQVTGNEILIKTLNNLALEISLTAILLSSLEFFRPLLTYRWISTKKEWRPLLSILDVTIYLSTIVFSALLIIFFTKYILDTFTSLANYSVPELRELINIYINSHIGKVVILVMALGIITYFLYNLVEPTLIYITRSKGQARDALTNNYNKMMVKERGYMTNVYKYLYIAIFTIIIVSIPLFIAIFREPRGTITLIGRAIENLLLVKWDPYITKTDQYFSNLPVLTMINYLKERFESFIRFIMYLLF